ncbi:MAG: hypothetical protein ACI9M6_001434 [Hydrogenophaga sp.]|jgi:hypothetical protein
MINIAQSIPVVWSPPASSAPATVAPVAAARPLQESARDGQPGTGAERDTRAARADRRTEAREVDRQAREVLNEGKRRVTGRTGTEPGKVDDAPVRQEAKDKAKQLAAEQAADEARRAQRQELLTNVWKASAAVVDRMLGREDTSAVNSAAESQGSSGSQQTMEELALPWPVMPQDAGASPSRADLGASEDVVAYDERGNGNVSPLEAGMLISHRV